MLDKNEFPIIYKETPGMKTIIDINGIKIGGESFTIFAGPCRIENESMILETASFLKKAGAHILRGGAFKPCTTPHSDWGRGEPALKELRKAGDKAGMPIITEAMDIDQLKIIDRYTDIIQIGMRNSQNYMLLREVGQNYNKPIFLKRGSWLNLRELLCSAEWIAYNDTSKGYIGNSNIMVCERGIVTFNDHMRWTLDMAMIPSFKQLSHLPIIVDISHGTGGEGNKSYYKNLCKAVVALGADGIMLEVHPDPDNSKSDAFQSLSFEEFEDIIESIKPIIKAMGKENTNII